MLRFAQVSTESRKFNEKSDCAVKAVAIACSVDYAKAHALLKKLGRQNRRGTMTHTTLKAIHELGFKAVPQPLDRLPRTVKTIAPALKGGTYLVKTRGHILAVVDGQTEDWTAGRRHRPVSVWKIEGAACPECGQPKGPAHQHPAPEPTEPAVEPEVAPEPVLPEPPKKQATRMIKVCCPGCGYTIRTTQKWIDVGLPTCCCGEEMEVAQ